MDKDARKLLNPQGEKLVEILQASDEEIAEMSEKDYTPEPWHLVNYVGHTDKYGFQGEIRGIDGERIFAGSFSFQALRGKASEQAKANAKRIVACVNACAGISTETLELEGEYVKARMNTVAKL